MCIQEIICYKKKPKKRQKKIYIYRYIIKLNKDKKENNKSWFYASVEARISAGGSIYYYVYEKIFSKVKKRINLQLQ